MGKMKIRSKIWLDIDGQPVFSEGREALLKAIDRYGSINQAAKNIGITYRRAWSYIKAMEERMGVVFVERHVGGRRGGGAKLTSAARDFLHKYGRLERGINRIIDKRFQKTFEQDCEP